MSQERAPRLSKAKIGAIIVIVLLAVYLFAMAHRGWLLMMTDDWVARVLGAGMIVVPIIGAWALLREIAFGGAMERLGHTLAAEGGLPEDTLPRTPGGRIVREAADEQFAQYRQEAEAHPEDWRSWFRLSMAYDASGDRKRARQAMRKAITLEKQERATAPDANPPRNPES